MKVTVTQGIRVVHDGEVYRDGQSVDVPEQVAAHWLECGWASEGDGASALPDPRGLPSAEKVSAPTKSVRPGRARR